MSPTRYKPPTTDEAHANGTAQALMLFEMAIQADLEGPNGQNRLAPGLRRALTLTNALQAGPAAAKVIEKMRTG